MSAGPWVRPVRKHPLRVGFVPLIDAAPIIAAAELGYFADEGADVQLDRQIGWGNVRDKLTYGHLHASHAPVGMPVASAAGIETFPEPLVSLMALGTGGCAITVARRLGEMTEGAKSAGLWRRFLGRAITLAHVSPTSNHYGFLCEYLNAGGLNPSRDATLCVIPPPQLVGHLKTATLDGFCAGEPWNTLAVIKGSGTIVAATTELQADHFEKVLAVSRQWYEKNRIPAALLVRAVLRGCDFCEAPANRSRLTEILCAPAYLDLDANVISKSLSIDDWFKPAARRPRFRSFARETTRLDAEGVERIVQRMMRWGPLPATLDARRVSRLSIEQDAYAQATETLEPIGTK